MKGCRLFLCTTMVLGIVGTMKAQSISTGENARNAEIIERESVKSQEKTSFYPNLKPYDQLNMLRTALQYEQSDSDNFRSLYDDLNDYIPDSLHRKSFGIDSSGFSTGMHESIYRESQRPILRYFYRTPAHFFQLDQAWFKLRVNPILHLAVGSEERLLFANQRGAKLRATFDNKVYVAASILESQAFHPQQYREYRQKHKAIPGNGFYKNYTSSILDTVQGVDYLNGYGLVGVRATKHIGIQFGYSKHFIGNGMRSLFLSDFGDSYVNLMIRTQFDRFVYQNIFAELRASTNRLIPGNKLLPKKYFAAHYLGFKPMESMQIGLFEQVVFSRNNHFEFHYLIPLILYRTVEGALGSPDNVMLGADFRWDLFNLVRLYSQVLFDEFKFKELIQDRRGWWGNKYALQFGLQYVDVLGIDNLDLRLEHNRVRPFMYSHRDSSSNFVHGNNLMAHPLGANFKEYLGKISYRPLDKWSMNATFLLASRGLSTDSIYYGEDPRISNGRRDKDYGHAIGQGSAQKLNIIELNSSYQLWHDFQLYLRYQFRNELGATEDKSSFFMAGLRWNINRESYLY